MTPASSCGAAKSCCNTLPRTFPQPISKIDNKECDILHDTMSVVEEI